MIMGIKKAWMVTGAAGLLLWQAYKILRVDRNSIEGWAMAAVGGVLIWEEFF